MEFGYNLKADPSSPSLAQVSREASSPEFQWPVGRATCTDSLLPSLLPPAWLPPFSTPWRPWDLVISSLSQGVVSSWHLPST